ncbi:MAG: crotonase, partial [Proteobacteria bacterium]|nr:crotonase [Pseudomonadota bacterium]
PEKLRQMVKAGQLGKKSGHGFYDYRKGKPQKLKQPADESTPADLEDRLILRILNECVACLREQIVEDADLLDAGMIFGTGFAPFRGGPMHYAKHRGYQNIIDRLTSLQQAHGDRFIADAGWQALLSE